MCHWASSRETWVWERVASHRRQAQREKVGGEGRSRAGKQTPFFLPLSPARTGCVDLTITNLLEGAVAFMPEDITEGTQSLSTASAPKVRPRKWLGTGLGWVGAVFILPFLDISFLILRP